MKQSVTMQLIKQFDIYTCLNPSHDYKFGVIWCLFDPLWRPNQLLEWFYDKKRMAISDEYVSIRKKDNSIALYDISHGLNAESDNVYYASINSMLDENKRFDMSYKNFEELLLGWEELRVSMPEIILLVIHEDNHVSLETDAAIIKKYQDAGYAFDIDKEMKQS
jgi:hypothetical protein